MSFVRQGPGRCSDSSSRVFPDRYSHSGRGASSPPVTPPRRPADTRLTTPETVTHQCHQPTKSSPLLSVDREPLPRVDTESCRLSSSLGVSRVGLGPLDSHGNPRTTSDGTGSPKCHGRAPPKVPRCLGDSGELRVEFPLSGGVRQESGSPS